MIQPGFSLGMINQGSVSKPPNLGTYKKIMVLFFQLTNMITVTFLGSSTSCIISILYHSCQANILDLNFPHHSCTKAKIPQYLQKKWLSCLMRLLSLAKLSLVLYIDVV